MSVIDWTLPRPWDGPAPDEYPRRPLGWYVARALRRLERRQ